MREAPKKEEKVRFSEKFFEFSWFGIEHSSEGRCKIVLTIARTDVFSMVRTFAAAACFSTAASVLTMVRTLVRSIVRTFFSTGGRYGRTPAQTGHSCPYYDKDNRLYYSKVICLYYCKDIHMK